MCCAKSAYLIKARYMSSFGAVEIYVQLNGGIPQMVWKCTLNSNSNCLNKKFNGPRSFSYCVINRSNYKAIFQTLLTPYPGKPLLDFPALSICTWFLTFSSWTWYFSLFEMSSFLSEIIQYHKSKKTCCTLFAKKGLIFEQKWVLDSLYSVSCVLDKTLVFIHFFKFCV